MICHEAATVSAAASIRGFMLTNRAVRPLTHADFQNAENGDLVLRPIFIHRHLFAGKYVYFGLCQLSF